MNTDDLRDLGAMMGRAVAEQLLDVEPITLRELVESAIRQMHIAGKRVQIALCVPRDSEDEQDLKLAESSCRTAIEKLQRAVKLLPERECND